MSRNSSSQKNQNRNFDTNIIIICVRTNLEYEHEAPLSKPVKTNICVSYAHSVTAKKIKIED
jgi:hypothetical protein